jgi:drug/metabolite transporter (DMT)-like permease
MFQIGISMVTATYAALMLMSGPLWTTVLERVFIGTPIGALQAVGMAIAFGSAGYLATGGSLGDADSGLLIGSVLLMACQTTWGGYTIVTKPLLAHRPPLTIVAAASLIATPAIWPVTGLMGAFGDLEQISELSVSTWMALAYLVFIAGVLGQVLYAYGLRDVTPSQAMAFTYLMPVFTAFFAAIFLDEQVTPTTLACGAAIVFGLWLVNRDRAKTASRPACEEADGLDPAAPAVSGEAG